MFIRARCTPWALLLTLVSASSLQAQTSDHQYSAADVESGSRLYVAQCALCHGPTGEAVAGINLRRNLFRRAASDDDLRGVIANGVPGSGMPPFTFQPRELDALVAFIRAGFDAGGVAVKVGRAGSGQALFEGKAGCAACHRVNGSGPRLAPDLSDIGAVRPPSLLQRKLLEPTATMWPINRPVRIVTREGRTIRGRRLNEDTHTVQIIDEHEQLVSLVKADLREYEVMTASPMPSVEGKLTGEELADLVAYLLSLKGLQ